MGFFQTTKKFFEPVIVMPKVYLLNTIDGIYQFIYAVFSLEIYKLILKSIEYKETEKFRNLIIIFSIGSTLLSLVRFTSYRWGWGQVMTEGSIYYYQKYLNQYIEAEGNEIEKIGTGRFVETSEIYIKKYKKKGFFIKITFFGSKISFFNRIMSIFGDYSQL